MSQPSVIDGVVYGADRLCAEWLADRMPWPFLIHADTRALGVWDGRRLIAAVAYDGWNGGHCVASIASEGPGSKWATRPVLRHLFGYPFQHVGRITTTTDASDRSIARFNMQLGFAPEATLRGAWYDGGDMTVWRMMRADCPWLEGSDG